MLEVKLHFTYCNYKLDLAPHLLFQLHCKYPFIVSPAARVISP